MANFWTKYCIILFNNDCIFLASIYLNYLYFLCRYKLTNMLILLFRMCEYCQSTDTSKCTNVQISECANIRICEYPNIRTCKYPNMRIYEYANMRTCKYPNMRMCEYPNLLLTSHTLHAPIETHIERNYAYYKCDVCEVSSRFAYSHIRIFAHSHIWIFAHSNIRIFAYSDIRTFAYSDYSHIRIFAYSKSM